MKDYKESPRTVRYSTAWPIVLFFPNNSDFLRKSQAPVRFATLNRADHSSMADDL